MPHSGSNCTRCILHGCSSISIRPAAPEPKAPTGERGQGPVRWVSSMVPGGSVLVALDNVSNTTKASSITATIVPSLTYIYRGC